MKKALLISALLIVVLLIFTACADKEAKDTSAVTVPDTADVETEIQTEAETETEAQTEPPVVRPSADGQEVLAYDVSFYLPNDMIPNEYNGMLGFYEFYTGEFITRPTGLDFTLSVLAESNTNGDLLAYAKEDNLKYNDVDVEPEEVEINGSTWLRFTISEGLYSYYAVFNDGLYKVTASRGGDTQENFDAAHEMLLQTLFLAVNEDW